VVLESCLGGRGFSPDASSRDVGVPFPNIDVQSGGEDGRASNKENDGSFHRFVNDPSFLVAPSPISSPTIGSGGGAATAMFFPSDEDSKASLIGASGFHTGHESLDTAVLTDTAFNEVRFHSRSDDGYGNANYDFNGT
jgi:hypothetical protein